MQVMFGKKQFLESERFCFAFIKARDPKATMKIETLNATFQPAKIGNPCGLQITYLKDNSTRNIFVYHSDAKVSAPNACSANVVLD